MLAVAPLTSQSELVDSSVSEGIDCSLGRLGAGRQAEYGKRALTLSGFPEERGRHAVGLSKNSVEQGCQTGASDKRHEAMTASMAS